MWRYEPAIFGTVSLQYLIVTLTGGFDSLTVPQVGFWGRSRDSGALGILRGRLLGFWDFWDS